MKTRLTLFALLLLFTLTGWAQDKEKITQAVLRWNSLHNTRETGGFKNIYAPTVLFYGRYNSRQKCYEKKDRFLSPDFSQEIISPVSLTFYSSGTVKCDFTKRVTYKNLVKEHECYLLMEEKGGGYLITGESDLATDKKLALQLHLGNVLSDETNSFNPVLIIAIIIALVLLLLFVLYKRRKSRLADCVEEPHNPEPPVMEPETVDTIAASNLQPSEITVSQLQQPKEATATVIATPPPLDTSSPISEPLNEKEKGDAFERYVVSRFTKEFFELVEWRSDKYHEGIYASSSTLPDLEYHFKTSYYNFRIGVECKWRAGFIKGRIEWVKSHQLVTYRQYEREKSIRVFVIIGVGSGPDNPSAIYIVPLSDIRSNVLSEGQLKKYYRYRTGNFFLNGEGMVLE